MQYRSWEPRSVDRAAAANLAKCLAEEALYADPSQEEDAALSERQLQELQAQYTKNNVLLAGVLAARGMTDPDQVLDFLSADAPLSDPMLLRDMDKACTRIWQAIDNGETIVIFGDYDVDGVTATALLYQHLKGMGADVKCMLPSREGEGYGLSRRTVDTIHKHGYHLIITVDNGISAVEEAEYAAELGLELIVTDHHLPPAQLPKAVAVVDPMREDDESPFKGLSGAGVAFKLCAALEGCMPEEMLEYCGDLAAMGAIADVMPLVGENRTLVSAGLRHLENSDRPGIRALLEVTGLAEKHITAENVSFALAPRINAAGRMDSAVTALQLLLCEDEYRAEELAEKLNEENQTRQHIEQEIAAAVQAQLDADPTLQEDRVVLVWGHCWHPGVIGIVASRLVEQLGRPVMVISIDEKGEGRGSGRSLGGLNLHDCIASCEDLLIRYGGHAMAAGLSVEEQNIPMLRRRMNEWAIRECPVLRRPPLQPDLSVQLDKTSLEAVRALDRLAPLGSKNPAPVFLLENVQIEGVYPVSDGRHTRLRLRQGNTTLYAVYFGMSPMAFAYETGDKVDVVLNLSVYEARSGAQYSGRVLDIRPAGLGNEPAQQWELFEAFCGGTKLTQEQKALLLPTRQDTAAVYQALRSRTWHADDLQPLFAQLGAAQAGKVLTGIMALEQLGLIARQQQNGADVYAIVPTAGKKDLAAAPILKRMEEM